MNKTDLVNAVVEKTGLAKKDTEQTINEALSAITNTLAKGEKVQLFGFGNFEVRDRAARKGRNPQTGEEMDIPASKAPAFKPATALKNAVKE
ncbi:HU family DNA-binding protein [Paenibacillus sp. O199]|uniref:HU family DNA-binding protein n=1 Tax=Paenibacillus sp. O199 TaxID=1643925 RepID=UPI0007BF54E6|nr:HU family DNA-binding protein [Paenibacillus sp. O199]